MFSLFGCLFFRAKVLFLIFIILEISGVIQGLFVNFTSLGVSCFIGACLSTHPFSLWWKSIKSSLALFKLVFHVWHVSSLDSTSSPSFIIHHPSIIHHHHQSIIHPSSSSIDRGRNRRHSDTPLSFISHGSSSLMPVSLVIVLGLSIEQGPEGVTTTCNS